MGPLSDVDAVTARLRAHQAFGPQIVQWRSWAEQPPSTVPIPAELAPSLADMLARRGIHRLYTHQAEALALALRGEHTVVVTPTASGKTLCYELPILQRLLESSQKALLLFPTKALAHDQEQRLAGDLAALGLDPRWVASYDGDSTAAARTAARSRARILISNPDMLHVGILPNHTAWRTLLGDLSFVVLDEMHTYRGVFGSQVAGVIWRLRRLCRFYGANPCFIGTSATIANPGELGRSLVGDPVRVVAQSGAPVPPRRLALYNPPLTDSGLGVRRLAIEDAQSMAGFLLANGLQTVCFTRSRLDVERLVIALRRAIAERGGDPAMVRGYRAGYLGAERRAIEAGLRDGSIRCVVATSALELGIDVGSLSACVLVGYPGNTSSFWQRIGRVGRGPSGGLAVLVASDSPLDQYLLAHADEFLEMSAEAARVSLSNLHVQISQVRCAAFELPLDDQELRDHPAVAPVLHGLQQQGELQRVGSRWFWMGGAFPAREVSLRTADAAHIEIVARQGEQVVSVGQAEAADALRWLHPGAVYLHEGNQYLVRSLDLGTGVAEVEPVTLPYMTVAAETTTIEVEQVDRSYTRGSLTVSLGDIRVTSQVTSFRREDIESHVVLSRERLEMPEQLVHTQACWLECARELIERLDRSGLWVGEREGARGPNWPQQRALALERDGHRCRQCGAAELPGRTHDVHHIVPFSTFGWVPGENDAYVQANRLDNLVTLCSACHARAEQQVAIQGTLRDLGHLLRYLVPLWLLCDPGDIGTHAESGLSRSANPTLFVYDRAPGGSGIAEGLAPLVPAVMHAAAERVGTCACEAGCPSCIGPALTLQPERKARVLALVEGLLG